MKFSPFLAGELTAKLLLWCCHCWLNKLQLVHYVHVGVECCWSCRPWLVSNFKEYSYYRVAMLITRVFQSPVVKPMTGFNCWSLMYKFTACMHVVRSTNNAEQWSTSKYLVIWSHNSFTTCKWHNSFKLPLPFRHYMAASVAVARPSLPPLLTQHTLTFCHGATEEYNNMNSGLCFENKIWKITVRKQKWIILKFEFLKFI